MRAVSGYAARDLPHSSGLISKNIILGKAAAIKGSYLKLLAARVPMSGI